MLASRCSLALVLSFCLPAFACDGGEGGDGDETESSGSGSSGEGEGGSTGDAEGSGSGSEGGDGSGEGGSSSGSGSSSGDEGTTGDEGTAGDTPEDLCELSDGVWEPQSCGNFLCGEPPACAAIIPGCDCGEGMNFEEGVGCVLDETCPNAQDILDCTLSGGLWDPLSCGHYSCGEIPDCDAIIPGCNCGALKSFETGTGCVIDPSCT